MSNVAPLLKEAFYAVTEYALLEYSSLFEVFTQCWSLNYVLAGLEQRSPVSKRQVDLIQRCWPFPHEARLPSVFDCIKAIPEIKDWLTKLPHIKNDPRSGTPVLKPLSPLLTAYHIILFWRAYRNVVVHRGGIVSAGFIRKHGPTYNELGITFPYLRPLRIGHPIEHSHSLVVAVSTVHERAAALLNEKLTRLSKGSRGTHGDVSLIDFTKNGPPMLCETDHRESWLWCVDASFRKKVYSLALAALSAAKQKKKHKRLVFHYLRVLNNKFRRASLPLS